MTGVLLGLLVAFIAVTAAMVWVAGRESEEGRRR